MSKVISIWGSPGSGKSTFAVKLASAIYDNYQSTVIVLFTDMTTPMLPVIFPNSKREDLFSVGEILSKTEITVDDTVRNIVCIKDKGNFGFTGYLDSENKFTYPKFDEKKAKDFIAVLETLADYVVIDCVSNMGDNILSQTALAVAEETIRLASPDLRCISWYLSQLPIYTGTEKQIQGMNTPDMDVFVPVSDVRSHLGEVSFTLPFCREVKQQFIEGKLCETLKDKRFTAKMKAIAERMV